MMGWELFLTIAIISFSINSLISRSLMKQGKSDPFAQAIILFSLSGTLAGVIGIITNQLQFPSIQQVPYLALGALMAAIGSICIYSAYKLIEASEVTILSSSQRIWSVLGAFYILGEPFSYYKLAATIVVIVGVIIASWKKHTLRWDKGAFFVLSAAFLFSTADIAGYYVLRSLNTLSFSVYLYFLPAMLLVIFRPSFLKHLSFYKKSGNFIRIISASAIDLLGTYAFFSAYTLGKNASVITPLLGTRVILTVVLGAIFLNERDNMRKKIIGAVIIILGSSLLLFH